MGLSGPAATLGRMPHEQMFDEDDPVLLRLREVAMSFPGAQEKVSHGRPAFFTKKIFALYGCSLKVEGEWVQHPRALVIQPSAEEEAALRQDPRVVVPAYWGPWGWVALLLDEGSDWTEVRELVEESFLLTAPAGRIKELRGR